MSEAPERNENKTAPAAPKKRTPPEMKTLPMLPLRGMVVFPYMIIHLDVGRERSLAALEKAMMEDHRILLVCQIDADKDDPGREDLYNYGTVAVINQILKLPGGTVRVLVEGEKRARISDYHRLENYDEVEAKVYTDPIYTSTDVEVATRSLIHRFEDWVKLSKRIPADTLVSVAIIDDAGRLADLIASHLNLKVHMRQDLLECINIRDRLELLSYDLSHEIELLRMERNIDGKVRQQMDKAQRDYYLREQIKVIRKELGYKDDIVSDIAEYRTKLAVGGYPERVQEVVNRELHRLEGMNNMNTETSVIRNYVEWLLALPWNKESKDTVDVKKAAKILDHDHYGLQKVQLPQKMFGVFPQHVLEPHCQLLRGFNDVFHAPHSRHAEVHREDIEKVEQLKILTESPLSGVHIVANKNGRQYFITGHSEYDRDTLKGEYFRDKEKGADIALPYDYFPDDDPTKEPHYSWGCSANLLFSNWLNYFVYQETPYNINDIE